MFSVWSKDMTACKKLQLTLEHQRNFLKSVELSVLLLWHWSGSYTKLTNQPVTVKERRNLFDLSTNLPRDPVYIHTMTKLTSFVTSLPTNKELRWLPLVVKVKAIWSHMILTMCARNTDRIVVRIHHERLVSGRAPYKVAVEQSRSPHIFLKTPSVLLTFRKSSCSEVIVPWLAMQHEDLTVPKLVPDVHGGWTGQGKYDRTGLHHKEHHN